jgi:hypothetical protein
MGKKVCNEYCGSLDWAVLKCMATKVGVYDEATGEVDEEYVMMDIFGKTTPKFKELL